MPTIRLVALSALFVFALSVSSHAQSFGRGELIKAAAMLESDPAGKDAKELEL